MLYSVGLVSAIQQCQSATGIYIYVPSLLDTFQPAIPYHPCRLSQNTKSELPASSSIFHWLIIGHFLKALKFVVICYRSLRKARKRAYTGKYNKHETP